MAWVGKAYQLQMRGDLDAAIQGYSHALELHPTAEAYTYRGWARSHLGDLVGAIADCHAAIDLDPEYGNPYNDIGAYYVALEQPEEAIPWLRMALKAKRYDSRAFPNYNLGRIFEARGDRAQAGHYYREALVADPGFHRAQEALDRLGSTEES